MHVITTHSDAAPSTLLAAGVPAPGSAPGSPPGSAPGSALASAVARPRRPEGTWVTALGAAGLVVVPGDDGDRLVLVRQWRHGVRQLEVPGGGQDAGETLEETAAREVAEETGLEVRVGALAGTGLLTLPGDRVRVLFAYFACTPVAVDLGEAAGVRVVPQRDEGIDEVRVVDPAALDDADLAPLDREVLARWWAGRGEVGREPFHLTAERTDLGIAVR